MVRTLVVRRIPCCLVLDIFGNPLQAVNFFCKFHTVAKSENELRPSQSVLFGKNFKKLARKVEEKEKENKLSSLHLDFVVLQVVKK
jgi:hypothetical protein